MKRFDGVNNDAGMFQDRNPAQAKLGSILDASWLNMMQDEVINIIEGAGITLDGTKTTQLSEAITKIIKDYSIAQKLPTPNVWAPLKGNLSLICGFNTAMDNITVDGVDYQVAARIFNYARATIATYFNTAGQYTVAKVNEPRYEKEGLLLEGRVSNNVLFSNTPSQWLNKDSGCDITELPEYGLSKCMTGRVVVAREPLKASVRITSSSGNPFAVTAGDMITASCRYKSSIPDTRLRIRFASEQGFEGSQYFNNDGTLSVGDSNVKSTVKVLADGFIEVTSTITAARSGNFFGEFYLTHIDTSSGQIPLNSECMLQLPQVEFNTKKTSFIPTLGTPVTREPDVLTLKQKNNIAYGKDLTIAFKFNLLGGPVNNPGQNTANVRRGLISLYPYASAYMTIMMENNRFSMSHGNATFSGGVNAIQSGVLAMRTKDGINSCWLNGVKGSIENPMVVPDGENTFSNDILIGYGAGASIAGARPMEGHISDFRIWDHGLTDIQMEGMIQ